MIVIKIRRGFTLIELLVVIAIIGILASVVLASVNVAREKGRDAAVKADMDSIVTQTGLFFDQNGNNYGGTGISDCTAGVFGDTTITNALTAIRTANGGGTPICYAGTSSYAVSVSRPFSELYTPPSPYWCADSAGAKCGITTPITGASCGACATPN